MRDTITTWLAAGLLATTPISAAAAGLGKLTVHSGLGQPLNAEVEVLSVQKDDLASLSARLASPEAFREARLEPVSALTALKFNIEQRPNGRTVVRITSSQPVSDPYIDMLVELSWASGRLVREFTVLLDPPAPEEATKPVAPAVAAAVPAKPEESSAAPAPVGQTSGQTAPATPTAPMKYGPVKPGETLHSIAGKLKPREATLDQMLVGLYRENPAAFLRKNMNLLKRGAILKVPEQDRIAGLERTEATREVKLHASNWNAYRQSVAAAAEAAPAEQEGTTGAKAVGTIAPKVEAPKSAEPARDVLRLGRPEAVKGAGPEAQRAAEAQAKLHAMQEQATAREKAIQEAHDRIVSLEKNIHEMQKLVEMKTRALSDIQKKPAAPAPEPKVEVRPEPKPEAVAPAAPAPVPQAATPAPEAKVAPPAAPGKTWYQSFLANPLYVAGGSGLVIAGALVWLVVQGNRRRRGLTSFEDSIMTGGELRATTLMKSPSGGVVDTGSTSFLTDFSQAGLGAIDTHDVDPIAEAEVYMAYGRDAQAEEILKEAMTRDASRHEIHLKLLEIYAARKNTAAFETIATELYAALGGQPSPVWAKAAELGRHLDPSNPLYKVAAGAAATYEADAMEAAEAEIPAFTGTQPETEVTTAAPEAEVSPVAKAAMPAADLDFALAAEMQAEEQPVEIADSGVDFDLDELAGTEESLEVTLAQPAPAAEPGVQEAGNVAELDFSLDITPEQPTEAAAREAPALDFSGINLDLDEGPTAAAEAMAEGPAAVESAAEPAFVTGAAPASINADLWQEVATKLDLARAYMEMGDGEGAREILQEVMGEGDTGQREEAGKMLASLA